MKTRKPGEHVTLRFADGGAMSNKPARPVVMDKDDPVFGRNGPLLALWCA